MRLISNQTAHLQDLVMKYPVNMPSICDILQDLNSRFEEKIQKGEETLLKKSRATLILKPYLPQATKEEIHRYASHRKDLEMKLKILSRSSQKEQQKGSMIVSDDERLQFLKRMRAEQVQLKISRRQKEQIRQFQIQQKEEESRLEKEREIKQKQHKKRQQIQRRLEELAQYKVRREEEIKERNREFQEVAHQRILLHRIQESYNKLQGINLEEKKKKLAQIREIHKPMSNNQFKDHLAHIKEYKTMRESVREVQNQHKSLSPSTQRYYKSHWYKQVLNQENIIEEEKEKEQRKQILKQLKDKQKKYSEYIKHNFVPDSSEHLIEERQKRMAPPIKRKKAKQIRKMGLLNLKVSKEKIMSKQQLKIKRKSQADLNKVPISKPKDYLSEMKKNRRSNSVNQFIFSQSNRGETLKTYAEVLEKKAEQRQQLQRVKNNVFDLQVDDMYVGLLNAKLKLLDEK